MLTNKYVTHQSGCPSFVSTTNSYGYKHCVYSRTVYAVSDPNVSLKYIPDHYVQLHTLSYDHTYEAAILVKRSLSPSLLPLEEKNNCALVAKIIICLGCKNYNLRPATLPLFSLLPAIFNQSKSFSPLSIQIIHGCNHQSLNPVFRCQLQKSTLEQQSPR